MRSGRISGVFPMLVCSIGAALFTLPAGAVTQYGALRPPFLFDITTFTTTLMLPVADQVETVRIPPAMLRERLDKAPEDATIEPLTLMLNDDDAMIAQMSEKLAISGREDQLAAYIRSQLQLSRPSKHHDEAKTIEVTPEAFALMDKEAFADLYTKDQHNLTIDTSTLKTDRTLRRELMRQLAPFLPKSERAKLLSKILKGQPLDVNTEVLPEFPRKMVRRYVIYRGPNCFHAALAFQSPKLTSSSMINVKDEAGYHRAMINYDELWRVLNTNFYEVNPDKQPLKFGDMVVFYDVPEKVADDLSHPVDFRWMRHAATYLFGGYTFSKGSKSPNTPYTVRTLAEEWKTWKRFTTNLGVKVYRRSSKTPQPKPPVDLTDWIY